MNKKTVERLAPRYYNETGERITEWDVELGWLEAGQEKNEYGEWVMRYTYHSYTGEELLQIKQEEEKEKLEESRRQLTFEEVTTKFLKKQINEEKIQDQVSLRMMAYYPTFDEIIGKTVKIGFKFVYEGNMYKTRQPDLPIQEHYPPGIGTESLYVRIDLEHTGALYDPIPYEGNMVLENGKYYTQDNVKYLCTRDTVNPVTHDLKDLIGLYVEKGE